MQSARLASAEKLRIVEESLAGEASVAEIARRHDIHPNVLHLWRRQVRTGVQSPRVAVFTRFLDDGRLCMSNNAAERALRGIAVGRHNWTFAGSDQGGERAAAIYTLIETAKLNGIDPQAWLADVLARLPDHPAKRIGELLPWNWQRERLHKAAA
jgi:transposase